MDGYRVTPLPRYPEGRQVPLRVRFAFAGGIVALAAFGWYVTRDEPLRPGDPAVHAEIDESTDCVALELRIDTLKRERAPFADAYVEAVEERRRELRCD